jgi:hypothetical protein
MGLHQSWVRPIVAAGGSPEQVCIVATVVDHFGPQWWAASVHNDAMEGAKGGSADRMTFEQLDFLYTPSADVIADAAYFVDVLGGRPIFAIEDGGTKVAMIELTAGPPRILLTDHLDGERPILVYRVADLGAALAELDGRGLKPERSLEIPHGPCSAFRTPGGHRIALFQLTRPDVVRHFEGRRDF